MFVPRSLAKSSAFVAFQATRSRHLSSLLIMPIQRLPRYQMLIEQILKHSPSEAAVEEEQRLFSARALPAGADALHDGPAATAAVPADETAGASSDDDADFPSHDDDDESDVDGEYGGSDGGENDEADDGAVESDPEHSAGGASERASGGDSSGSGSSNSVGAKLMTTLTITPASPPTSPQHNNSNNNKYNAKARSRKPRSKPPAGAKPGSRGNDVRLSALEAYKADHSVLQAGLSTLLAVIATVNDAGRAREQRDLVLRADAILPGQDLVTPAQRVFRAGELVLSRQGKVMTAPGALAAAMRATANATLSPSSSGGSGGANAVPGTPKSGNSKKDKSKAGGSGGESSPASPTSTNTAFSSASAGSSNGGGGGGGAAAAAAPAVAAGTTFTAATAAPGKAPVRVHAFLLSDCLLLAKLPSGSTDPLVHACAPLPAAGRADGEAERALVPAALGGQPVDPAASAAAAAAAAAAVVTASAGATAALAGAATCGDLSPFVLAAPPVAPQLQQQLLAACPDAAAALSSGSGGAADKESYNTHAGLTHCFENKVRYRKKEVYRLPLAGMTVHDVPDRDPWGVAALAAAAAALAVTQPARAQLVAALQQQRDKKDGDGAAGASTSASASVSKSGPSADVSAVAAGVTGVLAAAPLREALVWYAQRLLAAVRKDSPAARLLRNRIFVSHPEGSFLVTADSPKAKAAWLRDILAAVAAATPPAAAAMPFVTLLPQALAAAPASSSATSGSADGKPIYPHPAAAALVGSLPGARGSFAGGPGKFATAGPLNAVLAAGGAAGGKMPRGSVAAVGGPTGSAGAGAAGAGGVGANAFLASVAQQAAAIALTAAARRDGSSAAGHGHGSAAMLSSPSPQKQQLGAGAGPGVFATLRGPLTVPPSPAGAGAGGSVRVVGSAAGAAGGAAAAALLVPAPAPVAAAAPPVLGCSRCARPLYLPFVQGVPIPHGGGAGGLTSTSMGTAGELVVSHSVPSSPLSGSLRALPHGGTVGASTAGFGVGGFGGTGVMTHSASLTLASAGAEAPAFAPVPDAPRVLLPVVPQGFCAGCDTLLCDGCACGAPPALAVAAAAFSAACGLDAAHNGPGPAPGAADGGDGDATVAQVAADATAGEPTVVAGGVLRALGRDCGSGGGGVCSAVALGMEPMLQAAAAMRRNNSAPGAAAGDDDAAGSGGSWSAVGGLTASSGDALVLSDPASTAPAFIAALALPATPGAGALSPAAWAALLGLPAPDPAWSPLPAVQHFQRLSVLAQGLGSGAAFAFSPQPGLAQLVRVLGTAAGSGSGSAAGNPFSVLAAATAAAAAAQPQQQLGLGGGLSGGGGGGVSQIGKAHV